MAKSTQTVEVVITVESNAENTKFRVNNTYDFYSRECFALAEQAAIDIHLDSLKPSVQTLYEAIRKTRQGTLYNKVAAGKKVEDVTTLTGAEVNTLIRLLGALE